MKSFKLIFALAVLTLCVAVLGLAGAAPRGSVKASSPLPQVQTQQAPGMIQFHQAPLSIMESDLSPQASSKSRMTTSLAIQKRSTASPAPRIDRTSSVTTAGMNGLYHIPGNFPSINVAVAVLNFAGLDTSDVTFELDSPVYNEPTGITFGNFPGAGTHTVTITPDTGLAVTINFVATNGEGKGFAFNATQKITIDGALNAGSSLSLQYAGGVFPLGDPFGSTIYITGASDGIAIKNASVQGVVNDPVWVNQTEGRSAIFVYTANADPSNNSNITLDNLTITNATYGIKVLPETPLVTVYPMTVNNCRIGGAYGNPVAIGAFMEYPAGLTWTNNIVDGSEFLDWYWNNAYTEYDVDVAFGAGPIFFNLGQSTGGHFISVDAGVFHDNIFRNISVNGVPGEGLLTYGSRISQGNDGLNVPALVYNNRFYDITNPGGSSSQVTGLRGTAGHVYHNSIKLTGTLVGSGMVSRCLNGVTDAYNNALENSSTGPTPSNITNIVSGGTIDYNATYVAIPGGRDVSGFATNAMAAAAGVNPHGSQGPINFTADLHLNPAGPSSAENMGKSHVLLQNDIDGDSRDTTILGTRDAGVDEVSAPLTNAPGADVSVGTIVAPLSGGVPAGLPVVPIVWVKNDTKNPTAAFNLHVVINPGPVYDQTLTGITLAGLEARPETLKSPLPPWNPAAGAYTISATVSLVGDVEAIDDATSRPQGVSAAVNPAPCKLYNWDAGADGWTGAVDFGTVPRTFTKLGGVYSGLGTSWVTNSPGDASTYTEGAYASAEGYATTYPGANFLTSPWFDFSTMGPVVYISMFQSLAVEPGWDGSWVEYTTDGAHWKHLGHVSDPNGVNWYNTSVYNNSPSWDASGGGPPDLATMALGGYDLQGPFDDLTVPMGWWSSNGFAGPPVSVEGETGTPTGPFGYVFQQLKIFNDPSSYPDIIGAPLVKFRIVAFADAVNPPGNDLAASSALGMHGWAFDNFQICSTAPVFSGTISGVKFDDVNGNGVKDLGENNIPGTLILSYYGAPAETTNTDGGGNYSFPTPGHSLAPGEYSISSLKPAGVAVTTFGTIVSDGVANLTFDVGNYTGSISGQKFNDLNDNGVQDPGDPGLAGWTIELHKDSCNGALFQTTTTDANGNYSFNVGVGTYYVKEVLQDNWKQTFPAINCTPITVSGPSGSPTAVISGVNFGNWQYGCLTVKKTVDLNGNGIVDGGDVTGLPAGAIAIVTVFKNGNPLFVDTLGNGSVISIQHCGLVEATYTTVEKFVTPGWVMTFGGSPFTFNVTASGQTATSQYMNFKPPTWTGHKFTDIDGNGTQDAGEPDEANATISVASSGTVNPPAQYMYGPTTFQTDANGDYTITGIGGGSHTVSVIKDPSTCGNTVTKPVLPAGPGTYTFNGVNATVPGANHTGLDFGNYKNVNVTVIKYRDRNANSTRDAGEEGLANWQITATGTGGATQGTDPTGSTSFCLGPLNHVITEAAQVGWTATQGNGGYSITMNSGHDTTLYFGNFFGTDSTYLYRSFSADDIEKAAQEKSVKRPKTGKAMTFPNLRNVVDDYFNKKNDPLHPGIVPVIVGKPAVLNLKGKPKVYVLLNSASALLKSMWDKGATHSTDVDSTEITRGLDLTNQGKQLAGILKGVSPKKQRNDALEEMMVLAFNLALEAKGKIPAGFGALIYDDGVADPTECQLWGFPLNGKSVAQIKAIGDSIMTNYEFVPLSCYKRLEEVASKINEAFSCGGVDCETAQEPVVDTAAWRAGTKLTVQGIYPVAAVPYMHTPPAGSIPYTVPVVAPIQIPDKYSLYQNYPNPFNPTTTIEFDLPSAANVTLTIYNTLGQQVTTLFNNEAMDAGNMSVDFDASSLASGIYFYRVVAQSVNDDGLTTGQTFTQVKKMVLMK